MNGTSLATPRTQWIEIRTKQIGAGMTVAVAILACVLCWCLSPPISIEMPALLVLGAVFLLFPLRSESLASLQVMVCFYLLCIPVNQLALQNMYIAGELHLSYSVPIVILAAISLFFTAPKHALQSSFKASWAIAIAIITFHLLVLLWMLTAFYGYGHEHDVGVLGHIALYLLLFFILGPQLSNPRCRQVLGVVLIVFYRGMIFVGRGV